jgi:4a-hydroxytetrahydrobiopterin dehydratase
MMKDLARRHCRPPEGGRALDAAEAQGLLEHLDGWTLDEGGLEIRKSFEFRNFHETIGFVNALAWIANREDHHPDLLVGYKRCMVRYSTHAVEGLSENDFICAAKLDELCGGA